MFLYHKWLELPLVTRNAIAAKFGIIRKRSVEVFSNTIKSDGYEIKDIEQALRPQNIRDITGSEETEPQLLWNDLVDFIEGRPKVVTEEIKEVKPKKNENKPKAKK